MPLFVAWAVAVEKALGGLAVPTDGGDVFYGRAVVIAVEERRKLGASSDVSTDSPEVFAVRDCTSASQRL